jgi:hypothetical protein
MRYVKKITFTMFGTDFPTDNKKLVRQWANTIKESIVEMADRSSNGFCGDETASCTWLNAQLWMDSSELPAENEKK